MQSHGYVALLGSNSESWGWNLVDNHLIHNGDGHGNYPHLNNAPTYQVRFSEQAYSIMLFYGKLILVFQVGEKIRVILDCDDNTLAFEKNYEFLGMPFSWLFVRNQC